MPLFVSEGPVMKLRPAKIRAQGGHDPRQRRMLRLVSVAARAEPLHPAADVKCLVGGFVEDAPRGANSRGRDQARQQSQTDGCPMVRAKHF
jgi:hypothetical protein